MPRLVTPLTLSQLAADPPSPGAGRSALFVDSLDRPALKSAAGAALPLVAASIGYLPSALTNTSTTVAPMSGLAMPVAAGGVYLVEFCGLYSSSSTACYINAGVSGPSTGASGVMVNLHLHVGAAADTWHNGCTSAFGASNNPAFVTGANAPYPWRIYGSAHIGATGGSLVPHFGTSGSAGTITIRAGAWGWLHRIG